MNKDFFARKKDIDELQINKANASDVYTKEEVINKITEKITEIVADAPEDFDTLKETSDWINNHEDSAAAMNTAINTNKTDIVNIQTTLSSKVDKEEGKSLVSDSEIARLANVENYDDTQIKNDIALNRTTLGVQCKNLLKFSHPVGYKYTNAAGTATWTFNNDYSVSMVVNSQISSGVAIPISEVTLKKGSYIYSVEGYGTPNITHTQLYSLNADGSWTWLANLSAIENKITVPEKTTYSFRAYRNSEVTIGVTETFYPMLRYADITDNTYEPYKESVDERLIQNKSDIAINRTTLGTQCKNLLKNNVVTQTVSGVTFTINDDKSITVNGTATAQISFRISNKVGLGIGNYILTGCPSGDSNNTFYLTAYASSAWLSAPDFGSGCKIENKTVTHVVITIASGYTANNLKFYPMLRYADITDDTYEPYKSSLQEQINQLSDTSNSGKLLYSMSEVVSSPLTVNITGLFTAYTAVVCNVVTSNGKHSLTLPLKYIKSLGTSAFYEAEGILFYYVDDNKIKILTGLGQSNPAINAVKIISLF